MKLAHLVPALLATALLAGHGLASDLSVLQFSEGVFAVAPAYGRLHRIRVPGGRVLATEVQGRMARIDVEEGVDVVAAVDRGVAGREVHLDLGKIHQVDLAFNMAVVFGAEGTAIYYPGPDRLLGIKASNGYPQGVMTYGQISAVNWGEQVALYGCVNGTLYRMIFPIAGMKDLHVGKDSVITLWEGRGTYLHILTPQGFATSFLSNEFPGNLSARSGITRWVPVTGATERPGQPLETPLVFAAPGSF